MAEFNINHWKLLLRDITEYYGFVTQGRRVPEAEWGTEKLLFGRSVVSNSATPWNVALSMGFSRQEYWSGLPFIRIPWTVFHGVPKSRTGLSDSHFPPPGDLPHPGMELQSPALASEPPGEATGKRLSILN